MFADICLNVNKSLNLICSSYKSNRLSFGNLD